MRIPETEMKDAARFIRHLLGGVGASGSAGFDSTAKLYVDIVSADASGEGGEWNPASVEDRFYAWPKGLKGALRHADHQAHQVGRDVYVATALYPDRKRDKSLVGEVISISADQDQAPVPNGDLSPTCSVLTSEGSRQLFWRFDRPVAAERASRITRGLKDVIGANAAGIGRVVRLPGSVNRKPGREEFVVTLENLDASRTISPEALEGALRRAGHPVDVDNAAHKKRDSGKRLGKGERNEGLTSAAGRMRRQGLSPEAIEAGLLVENRQRCNPPLEVEEVRKIARSVGRYPPQHDYAGSGGRADSAADPGIIKTLADAITREDRFAQDAGGKLYRFSDGSYKHYAGRYIRRRVKEILEDSGRTAQWSSHRANEVAEYIRADAPELWEKPPLDEVNVANGILNLQTGTLRAHDPAFLSPVQVPVAYDPAAECPAWERFVSEVFPEDARELAFELAADLITPSRSAQKALLLLGEGSNGKSTYLRALTAFVGSTNAAGVSLHKLESDRFATARLIGKLANICPDLPSTHLTETSVFKAITGGDDLHAEYKYRESFEFQPYCRLVFSANHVPRSGDASHAFFRRWLVVPFDRTFEPDEQTPREELDARLSDPRELSGVLNKALEVLPRIRSEGFTESKSMKKAWEEFKTMTDPVSVFLDQRTVQGANAWVTKSDLHKAYNEECDKHGRAGLTATAFGLALKRARPGIDEAQKTLGERRVWCYIGIGLKTGDDGGGGGGGSDPGPPDPARTARGARGFTNCFGFDDDDGSEEKKGGEEETEITNKGNSVHSVHRVQSGGRDYRPVEESKRNNRGNGCNGEDVKPHNERLTTDEVQMVRDLVDKGMRADFARREVLRRRSRESA